jgi:lipopolysaccharide/colanic/teichoic acid biosynthesis glycosyltransferase
MPMNRFARVLTNLGAIGIVLAVAKFHATIHHYDYTGSLRFAVTILFIGLVLVCAYGVGIPDLPQNPRGAIVTAIIASGAATILMSIFEVFIGDVLVPRLVVGGSALLLVPWFVLCSAISSGGLARAHERGKVVLVADSDEAVALTTDLESDPRTGVNVVRVLSIKEADSHEERRRSPRSEERSVPESRGLVGRTAAAVLSSRQVKIRPLWESVWMTEAATLVLSRKAQADDDIIEQASFLHESGMRVRSLSRFYEEALGKVPLSELERLSLFFDIREVHGSRYRPIKRILDVGTACLGLIVMIILLPFVLLGNLLGNRGPLFYRQARVGKEGEIFRMLKFRTMSPEDASASTEWTQENDPRITRFGRLLRATHIDELPQMINLLRGELSIVGPRPEQPRYVEGLTKTLPFYYFRHLVRPGLTGWAQVNYPYGSSEHDTLQKLQYEFFYLRNQSLWLDLKIIGRTIRSVLGRGGR